MWVLWQRVNSNSVERGLRLLGEEIWQEVSVRCHGKMKSVGVALGWQHEATEAVLTHLLESSVRTRFTPAEQGRLRSQGGPMSGCHLPVSPQARSRGLSRRCFGSSCNVASGFLSLLPHASVCAAFFSTFVAITALQLEFGSGGVTKWSQLLHVYVERQERECQEEVRGGG